MHADLVSGMLRSFQNIGQWTKARSQVNAKHNKPLE